MCLVTLIIIAKANKHYTQSSSRSLRGVGAKCLRGGETTPNEAGARCEGAGRQLAPSHVTINGVVLNAIQDGVS